MNDIFISYARHDRKRVEPLAQALAAQGWSVWWDRDIPSGKSFDEFILDIRASRHPPSAVFASARAAAGALFSTAGSEHAHLYGITLLAPRGRRGCTSGCWHPDGTLPVDL